MIGKYYFQVFLHRFYLLFFIVLSIFLYSSILFPFIILPFLLHPPIHFSSSFHSSPFITPAIFPHHFTQLPSSRQLPFSSAYKCFLYHSESTYSPTHSNVTRQPIKSCSSTNENT
ncbi:hypothetical protein HMPREF6485_2555 [Segatella buccae ATCC 33574]|uniref:Uncharacterized protein n=1 Tax=Segatella buccae ATCC 33574 TaxID=873513 RepID=E6KA90_9BACT|nr:hypothetical protein HMPREF6485_2555 [Segatella buccae ATCC 33574]